MRFPRTIGSRISLGFGFLLVTQLCGVLILSRSLYRLQATQARMHTLLEPSILKLGELKDLVHRSGDILMAWNGTGREPGSPLLRELGTITHSRIPAVHLQILRLSDGWGAGDREAYADLYAYMNDSLWDLTREFTGGIYPDGEGEPSGPGSLSPGSPATGSRFRRLMTAFEHTEGELDFLIEGFNRMAWQANERAGEAFRKTGNTLLFTGIGFALVTLLVASLLYFSLAGPVKKYGDTIALMGKGVIPEGTFREGTDELGRIGQALNSMIKSLHDLSVFAEEIGKGNFRSGFSPLSERDALGNSLIRLRESLKNAAIEEEKRIREDIRRNWANQGIARFSEIVREHSGDIRTLSAKLISELVKYLDARVGGIFLIHPGEPDAGDIELAASYAYDRNKYLKKTIKPGEGLVGRCVQEGKRIFLTDLPEGYIKIKSGLGEDNPRSLMIVPIRFNEDIIGVIEIASLEIFQDFQIEFVERIASSIASSLSGGQARTGGTGKG